MFVQVYLKKSSFIKEAAKKVCFIGPATKRGGGKGLGIKKKELFLKL